MSPHALPPPIGAHMSIAGGFHRAIERGANVGCRVVQIFTGSNQQWRSRPPAEDEVRRFRGAARRHRIRPVASHASYLLNLASHDDALRERSRSALVEELRRSEALSLPFVVLHPGAHRGEGTAAGMRRVAETTRSVLAETAGMKVNLLFETTAGQGSCLGASFEELAELLALVGDDPRIGVCVDTCHLFAAGYDLRTPDTYRRTMAGLIAAVGRKRIRLFHVNDSKAGLGSRVDRHAHIGEGKLGRRAFRLLLQDPRFRRVPKILETPKGEDDKLDRRNLATLRKLAGGADAGGSQGLVLRTLRSSSRSRRS